MVSEINGPATGIRPGTEARTQQVTRASGTPSAGASQLAGLQSDKVHLTDVAARLHAIENAIAETPEIDLQRVESIRQEIADGSYQFNPDRISEKLVQLEAMLAAAGTE